MHIQVGIITISDRASRGLYDDLGGPALKAAAEASGWQVLAQALVPDDKPAIQRAVRDQVAEGGQRELPGFGEVMRQESMKFTPNAILSRSLAMVVDKALVLCLPGKPKGAVECLGFVAGAIPHCLEILQEVPTSC